jgi:Smr domain
MATLPSLPSQSLSWNQNRRSEQQIRPFATLDLHGHTKESAIRALTAFCEQSEQSAHPNNPWVSVITGTGSHSGALGGPILKQAIQKLLIKRQMEYCYSKKKGFFLVNVLSGVVLKANPTREELNVAAAGDSAVLVDDERFGHDTKLKFMARDHVPPAAPPILKPNHKKKVAGKKMRKDMQAYSLATPQQLMSSHDPLPSELAADQQLIQQAKTYSLHDTRKWQSQRDKEQYTLEQILQKTQQEELEKEQQEQEELQRAVALSQKLPTISAEDEELERILQLSLQEAEEKPQSVSLFANDDNEPSTSAEDEELERILRLSLQEAEQRPHLVSPIVNDHNDEELQKILSQSKLEHLLSQQEEEAELERVLRLSMSHIQNPSRDNSIDENEEQQVSHYCSSNTSKLPTVSDYFV